jgi:hypothetical protein
MIPGLSDTCALSMLRGALRARRLRLHGVVRARDQVRWF